ncbi:hypothetical protein [Burkholderia sp. BCC0097]|uniref:hypothetical protein n=1 Tax=Burkholderia sp. BCC0097 TaxID=2676289 RepID=UPI0015889C49|nr:hypothetical protein [Burkholderia sp. BCC0097]
MKGLLIFPATLLLLFASVARLRAEEVDASIGGRSRCSAEGVWRSLQAIVLLRNTRRRSRSAWALASSGLNEKIPSWMHLDTSRLPV